jgi:hypothetical protein
MSVLPPLKQTRVVTIEPPSSLVLVGSAVLSSAAIATGVAERKKPPQGLWNGLHLIVRSIQIDFINGSRDMKIPAWCGFALDPFRCANQGGLLSPNLLASDHRLHAYQALTIEVPARQHPASTKRLILGFAP